MKSLSKEAEAQILNAIRDVVAEVAAGATPTAAVVKTAEAHRLPAGFVPLVCQAYNTGRQTQQREGHDDILGKTAEFALADTQAALAELYPSVIDTPAEKAQKTAVDSAYRRPPPKVVVKAAAGGLWTDKTMPAPYPTDPADDQRRSTAAAQRAKQAYDKACLKLAHAREQFTVKLGGLTRYFRKTALDRIGWADFTTNAKSLFPAEAPSLLGYVDKTLGMHKRARSEVRDRFQTRELFDRDAEPYALLEGCLKAAAAVQEAQTAVDKLQPVKRAAQAPAAPAVELNVLGLPVREVPSKEGSFLEFAVGSGVGKGLSDLLSGAGGKPTSKLLEDKAMELEDPNHDAELRSVQARAMMADFMANDPTISGFDPDEVTNAYNEIAQVSPRASTQPALMRPLLRKRLSAGGIEPFEANEIANLEKTLGAVQAPRSPRSMGVMDDNSILG